MDTETIERAQDSTVDGGRQNVAKLLSNIASSLQLASSIERPPYNGMQISLPGVLDHAARALREMAQPFDCDSADVLEAHDDRCYESQPNFHAHALDLLGKRLGMLMTAIEAGDALTVRKFFEMYRFD